MAELGGLSVVKYRPHHPEGKARLEGAFGIIRKSCFSNLSGYNGGNPLKPFWKGWGSRLRPMIAGLNAFWKTCILPSRDTMAPPRTPPGPTRPPKVMLETKIALSGWRAQKIDDADLFDQVFSRCAAHAHRDGPSLRLVRPGAGAASEPLPRKSRTATSRPSPPRSLPRRWGFRHIPAKPISSTRCTARAAGAAAQRAKLDPVARDLGHRDRKARHAEGDPDPARFAPTERNEAQALLCEQSARARVADAFAR